MALQICSASALEQAVEGAGVQLANPAYLSSIPLTPGLSDRQKDEICETVCLSLHPKTQSSFEERWRSLANPQF